MILGGRRRARDALVSATLPHPWLPRDDAPAPPSPLASIALRPEIAKRRDEVLAIATRSTDRRERAEAHAVSVASTSA